MTRRWFLRGLGAVAAAVSIALPTFETPQFLTTDLDTIGRPLTEKMILQWLDIEYHAEPAAVTAYPALLFLQERARA